MAPGTLCEAQARAYLVWWFGLVGLALAGLAAMIVLGMALGAPDVRTESLVRHRAAQLDALDAGLVVVGDSSAGYGITEAIGAPLGLRATNLALNGSFGLEGTRAMMAEAQAAGSARHVLIMQTVDMLGRPPPRVAEARSRPFAQRGLLDHARLALALYNSADVIEIAKTVVKIAVRGEAGAVPDDIYRTQSKGRPLEEQTLPFRTMAQDDPAALQALQEIADTCAAEGLTCTYAHGPLWREACDVLRPHILRRSAVITALETPHFRLLAPMPYCMPTHIVGNVPDHVRPQDALVTTIAYAGLLAASNASARTGSTVSRLGASRR